MLSYHTCILRHIGARQRAYASPHVSSSDHADRINDKFRLTPQRTGDRSHKMPYSRPSSRPILDRHNPSLTSVSHKTMVTTSP